MRCTEAGEAGSSLLYSKSGLGPGDRDLFIFKFCRRSKGKRTEQMYLLIYLTY
jgi:hypothetical protein